MCIANTKPFYLPPLLKGVRGILSPPLRYALRVASYAIYLFLRRFPNQRPGRDT